MHPSKVQQSTAKQPDSGLRFGFVDISSRTTSPSKATVKAVQSGTPTKSNGTQLNQFSSPTFEFKWNRPDSELSVEGRKIMESVRDDAAKIKLKMQQERDEQARKDVETDQLYGVEGRKIAKMKGKAGRYSDVHMQEFKKMDSIAGHVSAWKNKIQANSSISLKRSKSKAGLDKTEQSATQQRPIKSLMRDQTYDRLENTAPGKRTKQNHHNDTSAARPSSRDSGPDNRNNAFMSANLPQSRFGMPSVMTTPTKASLARAASVKQSKSSNIPSLGRSKSNKQLTCQPPPKTEGNYKYLPSLPRFGSMKSILSKSQPKFSDDPVKVAAGTHLPPPSRQPHLDKELPSIPGTPSTEIHRSPTTKHVEFTSTTKSTCELATISPSPSKAPAPHIIHQGAAPSKAIDHVVYPPLAKTGPLMSNPTQPCDFTFRSPRTVQFGPATSGLTSPTIRQVRPSGVATPLSAFDNLPAIPHGLSNKKRRRPECDEEDIENLEPGEAMTDEEGSRAKRQKGMSRLGSGIPGSSHVGGTKKIVGRDSKIAKPMNSRVKGRGVLSLSRLNMLARPKDRR